MKTVTNVKEVVVNSALALVLIGGVSPPALASSLTRTADLNNNPLAQVLEQLSSQLESLPSYFNQIVASSLKPLSDSLGKDLNSAVSSATGALGLPDPIKSRTDVEQIATNSNKPLYSAEQVANEVDRLLTRGAVDSTLSQEGQQLIKQEAQQTQHSVGLVQQQAQAAQQEVATQNVMKQIALQNAQTGAVLGAIRADSLQAAQRQEMTNLNLTNISRSLDGQNQVKQSEMVGAGLDTLRITSRARLF